MRNQFGPDLEKLSGTVTVVSPRVGRTVMNVLVPTNTIAKGAILVISTMVKRCKSLEKNLIVS